jgi:hypothetical protein
MVMNGAALLARRRKAPGGWADFVRGHESALKAALTIVTIPVRTGSGRRSHPSMTAVRSASNRAGRCPCAVSEDANCRMELVGLAFAPSEGRS